MPKRVQLTADERQFRKLAELAKLVSGMTRLRMLSLLSCAGVMSVNELVEATGHSQPMTSVNLALLRASGLVEAQRKGQYSMYELTPRGLATVAALAGMVGL